MLVVHWLRMDQGHSLVHRLRMAQGHSLVRQLRMAQGHRLKLVQGHWLMMVPLVPHLMITQMKLIRESFIEANYLMKVINDWSRIYMSIDNYCSQYGD